MTIRHHHARYGIVFAMTILIAVVGFQIEMRSRNDIGAAWWFGLGLLEIIPLVLLWWAVERKCITRRQWTLRRAYLASFLFPVMLYIPLAAVIMLLLRLVVSG